MNKAVLSASRSRASNFWKTVPIALIFCLSFIQPVLAQEKERMLRTLSVSGRGTESIPTTISRVSLGVEVQGKTAQEVQTEAARRSSSVVALLRSRGVDKLQTTGINLNPIYSYSNNVQKINGYAATNTVSFRVAAERAGNIMDEAVKAGATRIDNVSFVASDDAIATAQQQALKKATQEAQRQADVVLNALGLKSKEVVGIQINNASAPPPIMPQAAFRSADKLEARASTPVVAGEQEVEASVTLQISY
ncbi:MAG: SIMPL domain-containing protein [Scytonematopsis contorta HA4267-MV1]|jgi:hypothetical protein|nr:SIMPL domain-containing protein [Scytonematopsis contorta HA4267-MV1]